MPSHEKPLGICTYGTLPLRAEPAHRSEMTNQLLLGDIYSIVEEQRDWCRIITQHDGYTAWLNRSQVRPLDATQYPTLLTEPIQHVALDVMRTIIAPNRRLIVPLGSTLPYYDVQKHSFELGGQSYRYMGKVRAISKPKLEMANVANKPENTLFRRQILQFAKKYLSTPYLWGGRSPWGIDCSGFTQVCAKLCGVALYRDAYQQAEQGTPVNDLSQAEMGDLAFFSPDKLTQRITHVGIIGEKRQIIHASGEVRIDIIDNNGILNAQTQQYSHYLRTIRRLI